MENEAEEENKTEDHKLIATTPDWLDLPDPIATNIILEHLEIIDYIRFSSVCKKWQSVQKEHRIRHSPYPPPSPLPFPWLSCIHCFCICKWYNEDPAIHFYLPNKQKAYDIPLYNFPQIYNPLCYRYGWFLLLLKFHKSYKFLCILNPITGVQIKLPLLKLLLLDAAYISSPPTDPDCTVVILDKDRNVYLYRLNDNNNWIKADCSINAKGTTFFCHNKIYNMVHCKKIYMVDALLPDPVQQRIKMDCSKIHVDLRRVRSYLVDFLGELALVMVIYDEEFPGIVYDTIKEFCVYKADFSTNKWMRMESLGDHAMFFSYGYGGIFSLPAVDVGCKKNTIYSPGVLKGDGLAWRAFDLSYKIWIDGPHMSLPSNKYCSFRNWVWFLPTLDCYGVAKTNGACLITNQLK